jgi:hypothetical protein
MEGRKAKTEKLSAKKRKEIAGNEARTRRRKVP